MRLPGTAFLYTLTLVGAAAAFVVTFAAGVSWELMPISLFIALISTASFLIIHDPSGGVISSTGTLFYIVIYLFDPVTAFLIAGLGYSIGNTLPRNWVTWRVCLNAAQMGFSAFLGSLVYRALGGDLNDPSIARQLLPAFAGPLAHQIANNFFVAYLISQLRGIRFLRTWLNFFRELFWPNLLSIPTAIFISILYLRNPAYVLLFLLSLPFQSWVLRLYLEKRTTYARIIEQLVRAGEMSLPRTRGHARRVATTSVRVARQLGLTERDLETIEYAALLHDVGMIGMDFMESETAIENRDELIDTHVRLGAEIVSELGNREITEIVLNHHSGRQVTMDARDRKQEPSLGARIVALAEEVDSRLHGLFPFTSLEGFDSVVARLRDARGTLFDTRVVDAFLLIAEGENPMGLQLDIEPS